jgi:tetratricopeptide (TPR) repeat protein
MVCLPRITCPFIATLLCLTALTLQGQSGDGFSVKQMPGLALVKPQPWSKDSEAAVLEFQAFINRTADGTSGAGYYEFRTKQAGRRQVSVGRIVKLVVYPNVAQLTEIVSAQDRQSLASRIEEIKAVVTKFPVSRSYLDSSIRLLSEELAQYDSGKVKTEGVWVPRQSFLKGKATKLAELLRADVVRAKPPSSFDLENDPRYLALKELADDNPDAKKLSTEISAQFGELIRAEKRSSLFERLGKSGLSLAEVETLLDQVRALKPDEDPKSAARLEVWDSGLATVRATAGEAERISKSMERELASLNPEEPPAQLSAGLEKQISTVSGTIAGFLATNPPSQLAAAVRQPATLCKAGADFNKLKALFEEKRYLEAKDILDELTRNASLFGPETLRAITGLRHRAVAKIDQFTRLRDEAKLLADSGKKPEALAKFEAAFSVIPDSDVGQQIVQLREDISKVQ